MTEFEHFVYAWSDRGLEGELRYQVAAATPKIAAELRSHGPLLDFAAQISQWEAAPNDQSERVLGWKLTRNGMFTWLKRKVPSGHWAYRGGHVVHVFRSATVAELSEICALIDPEHLHAAETAAHSDVTLPEVRLPGAWRPPEDVDDEVWRLAELLVAVGVTRNGRSAAGLVATSEQMIGALEVCAWRCPLPVLTSRNLSTSQPWNKLRGWAVAGLGPNAGAAAHVDVAVDTLELMPDAARAAAEAAIRHHSYGRGAIGLAREGAGFNPELFEATVLFLSGRTSELSAERARMLLMSPASADALDNAQVRAALIEIALQNLDTVGKPFVLAAERHSDANQVAVELASRIADVGVSKMLWSVLADAPALRSAFVAAAAKLAPSQAARWSQLPTEMAVDLLHWFPRSGRDPAVHKVLLNHVAEGEMDPVAVCELPSADDVLELLAHWWERSRFLKVTAVVRSLDYRLLAGCGFMFTGGDESQGWNHAKVDAWFRGAGADADAFDVICRVADAVVAFAEPGPELVAALRWSVSNGMPAVRYRRLEQLTDPVQFGRLDPDVQAVVVQATVSTVEALMFERLGQRQRVVLSERDRELMRRCMLMSVQARQMHAAAQLALQMVYAQRQRAEDVERMVAALSEGRILWTASALLFVDAVAPRCEDHAVLAALVERLAFSCEVSNTEMWSQALPVLDSHVVARIAPVGMYVSAVRHAARAGQFGMKERLRAPRDLVAWTERWA